MVLKTSAEHMCAERMCAERQFDRPYLSHEYYLDLELVLSTNSKLVFRTYSRLKACSVGIAASSVAALEDRNMVPKNIPSLNEP